MFIPVLIAGFFLFRNLSIPLRSLLELTEIYPMTWMAIWTFLLGMYSSQWPWLFLIPAPWVISRLPALHKAHYPILFAAVLAGWIISLPYQTGFNRNEPYLVKMVLSVVRGDISTQLLVGIIIAFFWLISLVYLKVADFALIILACLCTGPYAAGISTYLLLFLIFCGLTVHNKNEQFFRLHLLESIFCVAILYALSPYNIILSVASVYSIWQLHKLDPIPSSNSSRSSAKTIDLPNLILSKKIEMEGIWNRLYSTYKGIMTKLNNGISPKPTLINTSKARNVFNTMKANIRKRKDSTDTEDDSYSSTSETSSSSST